MLRLVYRSACSHALRSQINVSRVSSTLRSPLTSLSYCPVQAYATVHVASSAVNELETDVRHGESATCKIVGAIKSEPLQEVEEEVDAAGAPKKPSKIKFEKTLDYERFRTHIASSESEQAEEIIKEFAKNPEYVIATKSYNILLDSWIKNENLSRALNLWQFYRLNGVRPTPRSFSMIFSGLIRGGRTSLLPDLFAQFERSRIKSERLLADRYYRKESSLTPYTLSDPKSLDRRLCVKLPPNTPLPNGTFHSVASAEKPAMTLEQRQLESEHSCIEKSVQDYVKSMKQLSEMKRAATMSPGRKLMVKWFETLHLQIENQQGAIALKQKNEETVPPHMQHLCELSADKHAVIAMHEIISNVMANPAGAKYTTTCVEIGKAVETEIHFAAIKKEKTMKKSELRYIERKAVNTHQRSRGINRHLGESANDIVWSQETRLKLGTILVGLTLDHTFIEGVGRNDFDEHKSPAFTHSTISIGNSKKQGFITAHPEVLNRLDPQECQESINPYAAKLMPMYMSPQPWTAFRDGPYLEARTQIMRTYSQNQEKTLKTADLSEVCDLLTILGKLPWRINHRVYEVVKEGWKRGGNLPYVPNREPVRSPTPPADFRENPESRLIWRKEQNKTKRKNNERFSLRCDFLLKLKTAEKLAQEDTFFFPHNMDFRGRCYPIPPHLNHIGSDVCRGLLQFAEGKPLGSRGLFWLKAHLASLCGVNKVSFEDRVKYTDDHIADIIDSAENPLDGDRWWLEADDAWQCLSCCFELRDALRMKDPTKFVSHVPIHMDGSCNGLQHYAALGGDIDGGRSVNLLPADKPQDVYTHVLGIVTKQIEEDAIMGLDIAQKVLGKVIRKTIKQTVMTSVYGVTYIGARLQIAGQLRDQQAVTDEDLFEASVYVTKITFGAMQTMFTCARQIMAWLGDTARAVSKTGSTMSWVTPIGIPVEQHYRRPGRLQVKTLLQSVLLVEHSDDLPVLVQKQRSAFPPNYVHSLDSTHMFKTAKKCNNEGIAFAAVHDSFWTHASTIDDMNTHLRNSFVELHSRPLLEELTQQIRANHPTLEITPYPERGPLDINEVRNSRYFFH